MRWTQGRDIPFYGYVIRTKSTNSSYSLASKKNPILDSYDRSMQMTPWLFHEENVEAWHGKVLEVDKKCSLKKSRTDLPAIVFRMWFNFLLTSLQLREKWERVGMWGQKIKVPILCSYAFYYVFLLYLLNSLVYFTYNMIKCKKYGELTMK